MHLIVRRIKKGSFPRLSQLNYVVLPIRDNQQHCGNLILPPSPIPELQLIHYPSRYLNYNNTTFNLAPRNLKKLTFEYLIVPPRNVNYN